MMSRAEQLIMKAGAAGTIRRVEPAENQSDQDRNRAPAAGPRPSDGSCRIISPGEKKYGKTCARERCKIVLSILVVPLACGNAGRGDRI